jgi:predicted nucleotidyltransferase
MLAPPNLLRVARALAPIREQRFVFAGASILPLLLDDPAAPPPRFTIDVDAVVDVLNYSQWERLQTRLRECGMVVRANSDPGKGRVCLFHLDQIEVDIMPVRMPVLMRPSRMLELGFQSAGVYEIASDLKILALSAPGFLAAKLEAYGDRGVREFPVSKDLDDVVTLLDNRLNLEGEVSAAPDEMQLFIAAGLRRLLADGQVRDVIADSLRDGERERRTLGLMHALSTKAL